MTLEEVRGTKKDPLTPADIAEIVGANPQTIRRQAHDDPAKLGFSVCVIGRDVRIPRQAFIRFWTGEKEERLN